MFIYFHIPPAIEYSERVTFFFIQFFFSHCTETFCTFFIYFLFFIHTINNKHIFDLRRQDTKGRKICPLLSQLSDQE